MPADMTGSPWSASNARQEITESLYIYINTSYLVLHAGNGILSNTYKITMNTTSGWFELPNMWNKGIPGPILENPNATCGTSAGCIDASDPAMVAGVDIDNRFYKRSDDDELGHGLLLSTDLLGPLGTIAVALFGPGSWFDTQQLGFLDYERVLNETGWMYYLDYVADRNDVFPLSSLGGNEDYGGEYEGYGTGVPLYEWLDYFIVEGHNTTLPEVLTQASFYAIKALLQSNAKASSAQTGVQKVDLKQP
jgi:hypothetical protein